MQILFAAPFILLAGIVFTVLSVIPRARRWAIPIPTGVIGAMPTSLVGLFAGAVVIHSIPGPGRGPIIAFCCAGVLTGLVGGILIGAIARFVASILPAILLRLAVLVAGWCSYFVLIAGSLFFMHTRNSSLYGVGWPIVTTTIALELLLSFIAGWFVARKSEEFRPSKFRPPLGTPFIARTKASGQKNSKGNISELRERAKRSSLEEFREILSRASDVPPDPGDELPS
jgi:hypothetical protein